MFNISDYHNYRIFKKLYAASEHTAVCIMNRTNYSLDFHWECQECVQFSDWIGSGMSVALISLILMAGSSCCPAQSWMLSLLSSLLVQSSCDPKCDSYSLLATVQFQRLSARLHYILPWCFMSLIKRHPLPVALHLLHAGDPQYTAGERQGKRET